MVLCSDHGNVEEPEHARHTRNPVPLIALGPRAAAFAGARSIVDLTPAVLRALGIAAASVLDARPAAIPDASRVIAAAASPGGAS